MSNRALTAFLLCVAPGVAAAVDLTGPAPPDGLRGVLEAPTLFGHGPCTQRSGGKYPLRADPDASSKPFATLEAEPIAAGQNACSPDALAPRVRKPADAWTSPVPVREFEHGHPGLVVTDARPGWIHILLGDGEAWLQQPSGSSIHDYGGIVLLQPVHTLRGWDGRVCSSPRLDDCRTMALPSNPALRINRMQTIGGDLWFQVEFGIGACEGPRMNGRDVLAGWIPGFGRADAGGKRPPTLWMDAQGC